MEPTPKPPVSMWLWITLIIVAILGAAFFAWYFLMGPGKKVATTTTPTATTTATKTAATSDWLTYTNSTYGYSIQYPPTLSYTESDGTKNMYFQTAAEKAALAECSKREATECSPGNQIHISVDQTAGTTNDETGKTLEEIVNMRKSQLLSEIVEKTTLGGQPAWEGVENGLFTSYNAFTLYNDHVYDLTIPCDADSLTACKAKITSDQQKMIDSFKFL